MMTWKLIQVASQVSGPVQSKIILSFLWKFIENSLRLSFLFFQNSKVPSGPLSAERVNGSL